MDEMHVDVSIALGLLVSELSKERWKGKVINYGDLPQLHLIQGGDDLRCKCKFVKKMKDHVNCYPEFGKIFDLILEVAVNGNLKPEQMIRKVFVFSHQDFDLEINDLNRCSCLWDDHYKAIQRKFNDKGYGDAVPHVVFWTLSEYKPTKAGDALHYTTRDDVIAWLLRQLAQVVLGQ